VGRITTTAQLGWVATRLAKHIEIALGEADLSPAQYRVLTTLSEGPEGASRLADSVAVSKPSLTAVVDGLVARTLIDRSDDPDDRRRVALALTDDGRGLLVRAEQLIDLRLEKLLAFATDEEAALARRGLAAWREPLDAYRDAHGARR
jgi:long-chain acyl-CoA synthetase